jgi:hypothetical protein
MAGPCVNDTPSIALDIVGSPLGELEATKRNRDTNYSGTAGDDTTHNVDDTGVAHTLSQTWNIKNGPLGLATTASDEAHGIIVCAVNPIFIHASGGDISIVGFARLNLDGVLSDERDMISTGVDFPAGTSGFIPWGSLVADLDLAIGGDVDVQLFLSITQTGASGPWTFRYGGSKMVASLGY